MSNSKSKVTLKLSPKHESARVNEPLDVGSQTLIGFIKINHISNSY